MFTHPARGAGAALLSLLVHVALLAVIVLAVPRARRDGAIDPTSRDQRRSRIVWIPDIVVGEPSGGGGSGQGTAAPPGTIELPGRATLTVPAGKPAPAPLRPSPTIQAEIAEPIAQLDISALPMSAGSIVRPGAIDGVPESPSLGPGTGGRAGSGNGSGEGPGTGPGRGAGSGGNEGGGARKPGSPGLRDPKVVREVKPTYTVDAMRARIEGTAVVECLVLPDGTVGEAHVVQSVDRAFGLDQEALKAARSWLFQPGTVGGQPVAVLVRIELAFALR